MVYPGGPTKSRGGQLGYFSHFDGGVAAAVESQLGGVSKPQHLDIEMDICASGDSGVEGCTRCTDACPHEAVSRPAVDEVAFDETACMNCGACTSACPTGAVELREPTNERLAREVESLVDIDEGGRISQFFGGDPGIESPVVAFVCSEQAADALESYGRRVGRGEDAGYQPILPVRVNCTDTVGEAHVLHALAAGADGVAIVGCGDACLHSGPDPKAELVDRMNVATGDLELGARTAFFAPGATIRPPSPPTSMRSSRGWSRHRCRPANTRRPAPVGPTPPRAVHDARLGARVDPPDHRRDRAGPRRDPRTGHVRPNGGLGRLQPHADLFDALSHRRHPADERWRTPVQPRGLRELRGV
nr:hydrogenase iron-sulfur subunit [Halolamina pelagica]